MGYFENYMIMFGGKTENEVILNDFWVLDLSTMEWFTINYESTTNSLPKAKFLPSGELLKNYGQIVLFGGKSNFDDKTVAFLNLNILVEIVRHSESDLSNYDDKYFDYVDKVNKLWKIVEFNSNFTCKLNNSRFKSEIWPLHDTNTRKYLNDIWRI